MWVSHIHPQRFVALALTFQTFKEYEDDQYDFHTYTFRRMTFSSYIS